MYLFVSPMIAQKISIIQPTGEKKEIRNRMGDERR
jgi:hypothetical protein